MSYSCVFEYFPWSQFLMRHLEISFFEESSSARLSYISVILNDKLKIRQDKDRESRDLFKYNRICILGPKMTEIMNFSRTVTFIISPHSQKKEKEMSHNETVFEYEKFRYLSLLFSMLNLIYHTLSSFYTI